MMHHSVKCTLIDWYVFQAILFPSIGKVILTDPETIIKPDWKNFLRCDECHYLNTWQIYAH